MGGIPNMLGKWMIRRIIKSIAGSQRAGAKYYRRVPTGDPKRPYKYYYTKEQWERAHGREEERSVGEAARPDTKRLAEAVRSEHRRIMAGGPLERLQPLAKRWHEHIPGMATETYHEWFDRHPDEGGKPIPERQGLHAEIQRRAFEGKKPVPEGEAPVCIMMMGGPASGKSTMVRSFYANLDGFVMTDADDVKAMLPEYRVAVKSKARNAANMAHEESSYVVKQIRAKAIAGRYNLVIDGTGSKTKSYEAAIEQLRKQGYSIKLLMADVPVGVGVNRAARRASKTGRYVPREFLERSYDNIQAGFEKVSRLVDESVVFDTNVKVGHPPRPVFARNGDIDTVLDRKRWNRMNRGLQKSVVWYIIKSMTEKKPQRPQRTDDELYDALVRGDCDFTAEEEARIDSWPDVAEPGEGIVEDQEEDSFL